MPNETVIESLRKELFDFQIKHNDVLSNPLKKAIYNVQEEVSSSCNELSSKEILDLYYFKLRQLASATKEMGKRQYVKV